VGRLSIQKIDGESASSSALAPSLRAAGFQEGYKGLTLSAR
jgi:hypothetical protein